MTIKEVLNGQGWLGQSLSSIVSGWTGGLFGEGRWQKRPDETDAQYKERLLDAVKTGGAGAMLANEISGGGVNKAGTAVPTGVKTILLIALIPTGLVVIGLIIHKLIKRKRSGKSRN